MSKTSTLWKRHREEWSECQRCPLGSACTLHVLGRGKLPCDVLFLGEGPGVTEDLTGRPFVGRSGQLLDKAIAVVSRRLPFTFFISNVVACRPTTEDGHNRAPTEEECAACRPRVEDLLRFAKPKAVITLGLVAGDVASWIRDDTKVYWVDMRHPAYVLRQGGEDSDEFRQFVRQLGVTVRAIMKGRK